MRRRVVAAACALLCAGACVGATAAVAATRTPAQVVRAWSKAVNANDDHGAGVLFAHNALVIQGPVAYRFGSVKAATLWHSLLPCAGTILRVSVKGNVATATFRLGTRKGHTCDGPGQLAAARFTVVHGKITRWEQVPPDQPAGPIA
jgi:ketosteroid isomerase-like protein